MRSYIELFARLCEIRRAGGRQKERLESAIVTVDRKWRRGGEGGGGIRREERGRRRR